MYIIYVGGFPCKKYDDLAKAVRIAKLVVKDLQSKGTSGTSVTVIKGNNLYYQGVA